MGGGAPVGERAIPTGAVLFFFYKITENKIKIKHGSLFIKEQKNIIVFQILF
jgi:hypothetical protein